MLESPVPGSDAATRPVGPRSQTDRRTAALLRRAKRSAPPLAQALEDRAVRLNMPVARAIASHYRNRGVSPEDLDQVAYLGLVKAVRGFDPDLGHGFLGYAVPTIRGELRRYFRDAGWVVRPPRRIQELQATLSPAVARLTQALRRDPTIAEMAESVGADPAEVREALSADGCFSPSSLDAAAPSEHAAHSAAQAWLDPAFADTEARVMLSPALRSLGQRDRQIIEMRFFRGLTQQQVGEAVGVTQMQVSRLINRILADLRRTITGHAPA